MSTEKKKKPFYKKWWVWVIAIIIVAAAASGGEETEKASNDTKQPKTEAKGETAKKEKAKPEEKSFKIGDTVKVGKMTYVVHSKTSSTEVGPSILPTSATGKYVVIEVTFKNGEDKAVTMDSSFYKLKRGSKTYEADSAASLSANQGEDGQIKNSFLLQEVNPDLEVKGFVVFDVAPEIADATDLQLQVQTGMFGTETETINLQ